MRGDDSIVGQETLTPAQQRCTSTPPGPPTQGGSCPPAQHYVYVDDALGYLTAAQRDEAMRTGVIPDGLQSIPASGCAPTSTPPSSPPTHGGTCPPAQRYVYVDDALGYLTIAQRNEAMRTGIIPDGLQSIPASGCAPTSTPPLAANPPSGGYCPPSRQHVYNDDALGYNSLVQLEQAERGGELPDGLPSIPANACTPGQPVLYASTPNRSSSDGGFFPMESGGLFNGDLKKHPELAKLHKPRAPWSWVKGSPGEKEARATLAQQD